VDTQWCKTYVIRCGKTNGKKIVILHGMSFSSLFWYGNSECSILVHYHQWFIVKIKKMKKPLTSAAKDIILIKLSRIE